MKKNIEGILLITLTLILITMWLLHMNLVKLKQKVDSPPVKESMIDSLTNNNNIIIVEINDLDSIKDAKIIEVKNLDNDSTLKLFYELIGK